MQLWPVNEKQIADHVWPQYQIGVYPYRLRLTDKNKKTEIDKNKQTEMGQAPGTHWYHAHKHGSMALNVANGMIGAFVIEGQYDSDLRKFYGEGFRDQVLVIQQLSSTPVPRLNPARKGRDPTLRPLLSVNGPRRGPVAKLCSSGRRSTGRLGVDGRLRKTACSSTTTITSPWGPKIV